MKHEREGILFEISDRPSRNEKEKDVMDCLFFNFLIMFQEDPDDENYITDDEYLAELFKQLDDKREERATQRSRDFINRLREKYAGIMDK